MDFKIGRNLTFRMNENQDEEKKSKLEKHITKSYWNKQKRLSNLIKSEAQKVIEEKIKHYKQTNNKRKLDIYQRKLKHRQSIISKILSIGKTT